MVLRSKYLCVLNSLLTVVVVDHDGRTLNYLKHNIYPISRAVTNVALYVSHSHIQLVLSLRSFNQRVIAYYDAKCLAKIASIILGVRGLVKKPEIS